VLEREGLRLPGFLAWLAWAFVHVQFLALFNNKLLVFTQWIWSYFTYERGSRLITAFRGTAASSSAPPPSDSR
jgi:NADH dehydrogenase